MTPLEPLREASEVARLRDDDPEPYGLCPRRLQTLAALAAKRLALALEHENRRQGSRRAARAA